MPRANTKGRRSCWLKCCTQLPEEEDIKGVINPAFVSMPAPLDDHQPASAASNSHKLFASPGVAVVATSSVTEDWRAGETPRLSSAGNSSVSEYHSCRSESLYEEPQDLCASDYASTAGAPTPQRTADAGAAHHLHRRRVSGEGATLSSGRRDSGTRSSSHNGSASGTPPVSGSWVVLHEGHFAPASPPVAGKTNRHSSPAADVLPSTTTSRPSQHSRLSADGTAPAVAGISSRSSGSWRDGGGGGGGGTTAPLPSSLSRHAEEAPSSPPGRHHHHGLGGGGAIVGSVSSPGVSPAVRGPAAPSASSSLSSPANSVRRRSLDPHPLPPLPLSATPSSVGRSSGHGSLAEGPDLGIRGGSATGRTSEARELREGEEDPASDHDAARRAVQLFAEELAKGRGVELLLRRARAAGDGGVLPPGLLAELALCGPQGEALTETTQRVMRDAQAMEDQTGWTVVVDGALRVMHHHVAGTSVHGIRAQATIEAPLEHLLPLAREFDLVKEWNKYITTSEVLKDTSWDHILALATMWLPWPMPDMDVVMDCHGAELLEGEGGLVISFCSVDPLPPGTELPPACARHKRAAVLAGSSMRLEPLPPLKPGGPIRTRATVSSAVDAGIKFVPDFVLNFVLKIFAPFVYHTVLKLIKKEFAPGADGPLARRVAQKHEFYDYIAAAGARRAAALQAAHQRRLDAEVEARREEQQRRRSVNGSVNGSISGGNGGGGGGGGGDGWARASGGSRLSSSSGVPPLPVMGRRA